MTRVAPRTAGRLVAVIALVCAIAVAITVIAGSAPYVIRADFSDAGQLVTGNLVEVGGVSVGSVKDIRVTDDGQAEVILKITDKRFKPLHRGTTAQLRAVGAAGIANRYVALSPGPGTAPELASGSVLQQTATRGIVDLDMLLDSLDKPARDNLVSIIDNGATTFGRPEAANRAFRVLNPALSQTRQLVGELASDQPALQAVVANTATVLSAVDSRRQDLDAGVGHLASVLNVVARNRTSLTGTLDRAANVIGRARVTLAQVRTTLPAVAAMLRDGRPVVPPFADLLRRITPAARTLTPALATLRRQLPATRRALVALPGLAKVGVPALHSGASSLRKSTPILAGTRPYTPELTSMFALSGSLLGGTYDALGHYGRVQPVVGLSGDLRLLGLAPPVIPNASVALGDRSGLFAPCPGGAASPARDASNPWAIPSLCDPRHDQP